MRKNNHVLLEPWSLKKKERTICQMPSKCDTGGKWYPIDCKTLSVKKIFNNMLEKDRFLLKPYWQEQCEESGEVFSHQTTLEVRQRYSIRQTKLKN